MVSLDKIVSLSVRARMMPSVTMSMVNVTVDWDGLGPTAKKVRNASILKSSLQRLAC